jgi:hypothetical protein
MRWHLSWRADPAARALADRHYNRQHVGADQFVPPGKCLVLLASSSGRPDALWISSWPKAEYVQHAWAGAWLCTAFRNEWRFALSSELIVEAVAATRARWGAPPPQGFITFVDSRKTRRKRDPGRCFLRAGWRYAPCDRCAGTGIDLPVCEDCGGDGRARTKTERLHVLWLPAEDIGAAIEAQGTQQHLWRPRSELGATR